MYYVAILLVSFNGFKMCSFRKDIVATYVHMYIWLYII